MDSAGFGGAASYRYTGIVTCESARKDPKEYHLTGVGTGERCNKRDGRRNANQVFRDSDKKISFKKGMISWFQIP
jgi:hypothetical protein